MLVTNGSMQADAFLFDELRRRGRRGASSSVRATTARCSSLRQRGADAARRSRSKPDGIDVDALARVLDARRAAEARPHHPELPQPGRLHARRPPSASGCSSWRASTTSSIFEDDPYVALRFRGETLPTMLSLDAGGEQRRLRLVVLKDRLPGHPRRLPGRPGRADRARSSSARPTPTSRRAWSSAGDRLRVLRVGRDRALDRARPRARWRSASTRSPRRCASELPGRVASSRPTAATSSGSSCPTASTRRPC